MTDSASIDASALGAELTSSCWHLVAHRSEIGKDRNFLRLSWLFGDLAICNDNGQIVAFDNACPHRGTRFFTAEFGNAPIVCPYHAWTYRDGRLLVPKANTYRSTELENARLNAYRTAWCGDFLFVGISPEVDLQTQLGDTYSTLETISGDLVGRHDFNSGEWSCNWQVAVENALEPDHVPLLHSQTLGTLDLDRGTNSFTRSNSSWHADVKNARTVRSLKALRRLFDIRYQYEGYMSIFIFPFTFISSTFGYSYSLQNFFPSPSGKSTYFASRLLASRTQSKTSESSIHAFLDSVAQVNRRIFEEDYAICQRISSTYRLNRPDRIFSEGEEKVRHFRHSLLSRS